MFCPKCGKKIPDDAVFCRYCGTKIVQASKTPIDSNPTSSKSTTASQINNERIVSEHMKPETEKTSKPESVTKKRDLKDKLIIMLILIVSVLVLLIVFSSIKKGKTSDQDSSISISNSATASNSVSAPAAIDLYNLRNLSEDELVDKLGFTKNDNGMYPSENDYAIQYVDGKIVAITLTENDRGRFSLNGIQIGDTLSSAEKKLESEFTKIGSRVNSDGGNDTVYSGNNNETIVVSADNNDTVVGLGYTLMDSAAIGESMESSTDDSSSDMSTELVSDNDTQEMYADVLSKYSQYDGAEYGTFDIDGDGVDELIISYGTMSADWNNDIYSVIDGKAKKIGEVSGTQKFYKADDQNGIYAVYGHMGSEIIQRIVLSDGKISKIKVKDTTIKAGEEYYSNDYPIQMYYFDGSPVESEESESEESESDSIGNPASEYVLPESSDRLLSKDELEGLSSDDLMIARNEIYARHGRKFKDQKLQDYFDSCAWYDGYIEPEDFDDSVLSDIEKKNAELILSVENSKK